jgi:hypothetical protein
MTGNGTGLLCWDVRGHGESEGKRTRSFFTDPWTVSYIQPAVLFVPSTHDGSASMKEQQRAEAVVETVPENPSRPDGTTDIYLIFDGRRIAKRGKPGTLHAMSWISLEPGVVVRDVPMPESESGWGMPRNQ